MTNIVYENHYGKMYDNGEVELSIDWKDFDIAHIDYFYIKNHPDEENAQLIEKFYEKIYAKVAEECNKSQEYTIDCFQEHYTCRKISDIEQIHYDAMTDTEKAQYNAEKLENAINSKRAERDELLRTEVDPFVTNPIRWGELSEEEQNLYKSYRVYLLDIPQQPEFPNIEILHFEEYKLTLNK